MTSLKTHIIRERLRQIVGCTLVAARDEAFEEPGLLFLRNQDHGNTQEHKNASNHGINNVSKFSCLVSFHQSSKY
jgi:hypothetical protein